MGDVNLEIKLNNLDERVTELEKTGGGGESYITSVNDDFNVINKKLSLSERITTKLSELEDDVNTIEETIDDNADWLSSKNIFNGNIELGNLNAQTGTEIASTTRTRSTNLIKVKPNTAYTFTRVNGATRVVLGYKSDKTVVSDGTFDASNKPIITSNVNKTFTFTTTPTTEYIRWYDSSCTDVNEQVMIEEGEVATPYAPYNKSNAELTKKLTDLTDDSGWITIAGTLNADIKYRKVGKLVNILCFQYSANLVSGWNDLCVLPEDLLPSVSVSFAWFTATTGIINQGAIIKESWGNILKLYSTITGNQNVSFTLSYYLD